MKTSFMIVVATLAILAAPRLTVGQKQSELEKQADAVRATKAEMRYNEIPWVRDLFEGFKLAEQENRPVFLYVITGDPLDDC